MWSVSAALELSSPTDTLCITTLKVFDDLLLLANVEAS